MIMMKNTLQEKRIKKPKNMMTNTTMIAMMTTNINMMMIMMMIGIKIRTMIEEEMIILHRKLKYHLNLR